jgi:hypothetical protein
MRMENKFIQHGHRTDQHKAAENETNRVVKTITGDIENLEKNSSDRNRNREKY